MIVEFIDKTVYRSCFTIRTFTTIIQSLSDLAIAIRAIEMQAMEKNMRRIDITNVKHRKTRNGIVVSIKAGPANG